MTYDFDWVSPVSPLAWASVQLRSSEPYGNHVRPLCNFQEDLAVDDTTDPVRAADGNWGGLWEDLAASLQSCVGRFALVAAEGEQLAGCVRFLPKPLSRPRYGAWSLVEHRTENDASILWIGAAAVEIPGFGQGLPRTLISSLIEEARRLGYERMQALAWSNVPVYALWGQALPWVVYEEAGFHSIAEASGASLCALPDMIAGIHGGIVRKIVTAQLERAALSPVDAEHFAIVERSLN